MIGAMSDAFLEQLGIPEPDINLEVGLGSQAEQTAAIMMRYEKPSSKECSEVVSSGRRCEFQSPGLRYCCS